MIVAKIDEDVLAEGQKIPMEENLSIWQKLFLLDFPTKQINFLSWNHSLSKLIDIIKSKSENSPSIVYMKSL